MKWGIAALTLCLLAVGIVVVLKGHKTPEPAAQIGRYQFFQGSYDATTYFIDNGEIFSNQSVIVKSLLKIDTMTGKAWEYTATTFWNSNKSDSLRSWREMQEVGPSKPKK